jgi:mono/diheme cytochrome c family protein
MRRTLPMTLAALAIAVVATGAQTSKPAAPAGSAAGNQTGNAVKGKQIFNSHGCWQCHGRQAQGGAAGPRLGPDPMPLAAFVAYVRKPANQMPPFRSTIVSDAELADVHAFLRSLPQPPPLESIELLK